MLFERCLVYIFLKDKGGKITEIQSQAVGDHVIDTHIRGEVGVSPGMFIGE